MLRVYTREEKGKEVKGSSMHARSLRPPSELSVVACWPIIVIKAAFGNHHILVEGRKSQVDFWQFPGGRMHEGESPSVAGARKAKDEMDLELLEARFGLLRVLERRLAHSTQIVSVVSVSLTRSEWVTVPNLSPHGSRLIKEPDATLYRRLNLLDRPLAA